MGRGARALTGAAEHRAVVLLSGGLDSATTLAIAARDGCRCFALSFAYGQRNAAEIGAARRVAAAVGAAEHRCFTLDLAAIADSALTDPSAPLPANGGGGIPPTYVPARNTVFLALALAWAETLDARSIYLGVNAVDYPGYPDCRPRFIESFEKTANLATRAGVEGGGFRIVTPLIALTKAGIISRGVALGLDYSLTVSCYRADERGRACGECDACRFRRRGFEEAGVPDPTAYRPGSVYN
ncbi:MAG: 7-cyano-7-deazaguanine synthase QueC [Gammaproteobacteria bacterium]|nr:7-cyano-7-deazaguanine synthase QueC [Gammaproteobacteria bacterium]